MGAEGYEVVLVDLKNSRKKVRRWRPDELLSCMAWLKRMNARGYDIFIAPAGRHGLCLIDGLRPSELPGLDKYGLNPSATVRTSLGQYQAWIKVAEHPLADGEQKRVIKRLTTIIQEMSGRAQLNELGRLAGFTSNSSTRDKGAFRCYAVVQSSIGAIAKNASTLLYDAQIPQAVVGNDMGSERIQKIESVSRYRAPSRKFR